MAVFSAQFGALSRFSAWVYGLIILALIGLPACAPLVSQQPVSQEILAENRVTEQPQTSTLPPNLGVTLPPSLLAYAHPIRFGKLSLDEGLSQSVVADILQDQQGFLWFATQDGLNRYDGYQFKVYKNDPADSNSPIGNLFTGIEIGPDGILWAGASTGLNGYDPRTGIWSRYLHDPQNPASLTDNNISSLRMGSDGSLWVGTTNAGLNHLDPASGEVTRYTSFQSDSQGSGIGSILTILEDRRGDIWVGTSTGGLIRLNPANGQFIQFVNQPEDPASLSQNTVQALFEDRQGRLWIGTAGGLNLLNEQDLSFRNYRSLEDDPASLSLDSVLSIFEDRWGRFWVGTAGGGLNLMDRESGQFTSFVNDPDQADTISNDHVFSIFEDRSGMLWFGTFGGGVSNYDPYKVKFLHVRAQSNTAAGLSVNTIWAIYQDQQQSLWVGTHGGGLNRFLVEEGTWSYYTTEANGLSDNSVFSMAEDKEGFLWLGGALGLNRFNRNTGMNEVYLRDQTVLSILEDRQGVLWFGTATNGLGRLDRSSGEIQYYQFDSEDPTSLGSNTVMTLREVGDDLWVGTSGGGLNLMNRITGKFKRFVHNPMEPTSLSNDIVLCIQPTQDQDFLWLGTGGGLNRLEINSGKAVAYREQDGLPNDLVYAILEDNQGDLWLSTNRGIARFDPQTEAFYVYDRSDGLQEIEYNQGAYYKNQDGILFFGGINGFNLFDPSAIQDNPFVPPVVITNFRLFNKAVEVGPDSPLSQPIESSQTLRLNHKDDFFEIEFAALHFSNPAQNQYAFKIEGLDEDWNFIGNRHFISFTRLPPGNYTLRIKGSNSDGVWNEAGTSLEIIIPPPFWQTLWFQLLAAGCLIGAAGTGVYLRIRSVEEQRRRLEILVDERTHQLRETMTALEHSKDAAEAANRAKSVFLANMSHEFRTPLNAILGFTQIMTRDERLNSDQHENVEIIHRSSEHLLGLINGVLDMSKIEAGRIVLQQAGFDLERMLAGLGEMFQLRAEQKGVDLRLEVSPLVPAFGIADEGKLRQVLMNLLGNAVKFTSLGEIVLRVYPLEPGEFSPGSLVPVCFEVQDSGPGMTAEEIQTIFTPFTQASAGEQSQEGTGLGLSISQQFVRLMGSEIQVESQPGMGSLFRFVIPVEAATASDLEKPRPTRRVTGLQPDQPEYRILIVDDQEINRRLVRKILTPLGFQVREARNGEEAVKEWSDWQPQLIFMDMRMPVMDGYAATREIKASTRGQATSIIALTASGLEEEKSLILSEGCDDYLRKPFREEDLLMTIGRHLGVRFVEEEIETPQDGQHGVDQMAAIIPSRYAATGDDELALRLAGKEIGWIEELERAAVLGDEQAIHLLTRQIGPEDSLLAEGINSLAARFDHDSILNLIKKAKTINNYGS